MVGLRGFPNIQGGVEAYAENIAPLLLDYGCEVEVIVRSPYMPRHLAQWKGVTFTRIWAPRTRSLETFVHTLIGILYAGLRRPDVIHIQAIGPALLAPLARALGLKVVVTHHGEDYRREKWGQFARTMLRLGEWAGMRFADARISVSEAIQASVVTRFGVDCEVIPNGVTAHPIATTTGALQKFNLTTRKYILSVARWVPEKRQDDLINAFSRACPSGWKLAIVGGADHSTSYSETLEKLICSHVDVVSTGFVSGLALQELYSHAGLFVLPSSHEGLPIALLEALSYGVPALASDIAANREVGLPNDNYFVVGDISVLASKLLTQTTQSESTMDRTQIRTAVLNRFSWQRSAEQTARLLRRVASRGKERSDT
jgi:glycosyltransferase involved in cell wall biosynthesis